MSTSVNIRPFGKNTAAADSIVITDAAGRLRISTSLGWNETTPALTIGEDDSGGDFKAFGDTASCYIEYDASSDILNVVKSSAATSGMVRSSVVTQTMTAAATGNQMEAFKSEVISAVKTGGWCNAVVGRISYGTAGYANGMAAAIVGDMQVPNAVLTRGGYYSADLELDIGSSCANWPSAGPVAWINFGMYGTTTTMDSYGYLFSIPDVAAGTGSLYDTDASGATGDATLKIIIGGVVKYLLLADDAG